MGTLVESPSARMMHILAKRHTQGGLDGGVGQGISKVVPNSGSQLQARCEALKLPA